MKPIIGLVSKHKETDRKRNLTYICDEMKDVIFKNNAIAIGIVPSMKKITLVNQANETEIYKNLENIFTEQEQDDMAKQIKLCLLCICLL